MSKVSPPVLCRALLWLCVPQREAESLTGDLEEEFRLLATTTGMKHANRWYARQVICSLPCMLAVWIRRGELTRTLLMASFAFVLPVRLIDALHSYTLSQIPLKEDSVRSSEFLALMLAMGFACAAMTSFAACGKSGAALFRCSLLASAMFALAGVLAVVMQSWHAVWELGLLTLGSLAVTAGAWMRLRIAAMKRSQECDFNSGGCQ